MELSHAFLLGAILLLTALFFYLQHRKQVLIRPVTPTQIRPKRHVVLRIQGISDQKTLEDLKQDLTTIATTDEILKETIGTMNPVSLVHTQGPWACATASFYSEHLDTELVDRFSRASVHAKFKYQYDCTFHDITPIYEDKNDSRLEQAHAILAMKLHTDSMIVYWLYRASPVTPLVRGRQRAGTTSGCETIFPMISLVFESSYTATIQIFSKATLGSRLKTWGRRSSS